MAQTQEHNSPHDRVFCVEDIARICHEANRALCGSQGDWSQAEWHEAASWQRESACEGVRFHLAHPEASPSAGHANWLAKKRDEGWCYGEVKDAQEKRHPCLVPFDELPAEHQAKDHVFGAIVAALAPFVVAY